MQTLTGVVGVTEDVGIDVKRGRGVAVSQCITHLYDVHPALLSDLGGEEQLSTLAPSSEQRQSAVIIPFPRHRIKRPVKKENAPDEAPHPAPRSA